MTVKDILTGKSGYTGEVVILENTAVEEIEQMLIDTALKYFGDCVVIYAEYDFRTNSIYIGI